MTDPQNDECRPAGGGDSVENLAIRVPDTDPRDWDSWAVAPDEAEQAVNGEHLRAEHGGVR